MKKLMALLLVTAAAITLLVSAGSTEASDVIVIATDATWPPMEFVNSDKEIVGFDIDLMMAAAEAAGFEVEFRNTAWDGIFAGLANGSYDAVMSAVTITEERMESMDFSVPYINAGQVLIVSAESAAAGIETLADLVGEKVGAQIGTTGAFAVQDVAGVELSTYDELGLAIEALAQGQIAGVVADTPIAADYVLQNDSYMGKLAIVGDAFTDEFYGVAVMKGNEEVLAKINEGLKMILGTAIYDEIEDKWLR